MSFDAKLHPRAVDGVFVTRGGKSRSHVSGRKVKA